MKRTLFEELERIHSITYGRKIILEDDLVNKLLKSTSEPETKQISDDPKKADLLNNNPDNFFKNLQQINEPISQQEYGSMDWHKDVETFQIALELLGYNLPVHGIDGLFGPETAAAVKKYKDDHNLKNIYESYIPGIDEMVWNKMSWGMDGGQIVPGIKWKNHDTHIHFGFTDSNVAIKVIEKAQSLGLKAAENPYTSNVDPVHTDNSFHYQNFDGDFNGKKLGKGLDVSGDTNKMTELYNWVKNEIGSGVDIPDSAPANQPEKEVVTPAIIDVMEKELRQRGVTKDDLTKYVDFVLTGGSSEFTNLDLTNPIDVEKYAKLCESFIAKRPPNLLKITGQMMAKAAVNSFRRYHKYVPPELALAQLTAEGGIGNPDTKSLPIRTKNPYNVGNWDNGKTSDMATVERGIQAYYDTISKNYLGKSKTAKDLLQNFVSQEDLRYASAENYEKILTSIAKQVNRLSKTMGFSV